MNVNVNVNVNVNECECECNVCVCVWYFEIYCSNPDVSVTPVCVYVFKIENMMATSIFFFYLSIIKNWDVANLCAKRSENLFFIFLKKSSLRQLLHARKKQVQIMAYGVYQQTKMIIVEKKKRHKHNKKSILHIYTHTHTDRPTIHRVLVYHSHYFMLILANVDVQTKRIVGVCQRD